MLERWNPVMDVTRTLADMDRLFTEPFTAIRNFSGVWSFRPAIDLYELGDHLVVRTLVPGATAKDIDVTLERNVLTISGRFGIGMSEDEAQKVTWYRREIGEGRFSESIALPVEVDGDHVEAYFKDGILTLRLPKVEQARTRKIAVRGEQPALAESTS